MGIHTGTPLLAAEDYIGADVHRAARIAAAGHGGQVLVSAATAALVAEELRDLGEHRLKDLTRAGADLAAGRTRLSAAEDAVPHEPARPGDRVPRS